jgi:hypothetical protein
VTTERKTEWCAAEIPNPASIFPHRCFQKPNHVGEHQCGCGFAWMSTQEALSPVRRTYVVSAASVVWRSTKPLIRDRMPQLGTAYPGSAMRGLTIEEALEEADNEILWLEQELANLKTYRDELATTPSRPNEFIDTIVKEGK